MEKQESEYSEFEIVAEEEKKKNTIYFIKYSNWEIRKSTFWGNIFGQF